ncbi:MAG: SDR family NAD(P)-dependent oxidoreductase [candidate division Zixibacteria bacterium]|nr:SDR family NAD(P)-dependent oxidoreductase [candidate division Zixibacteria bacterium]
MKYRIQQVSEKLKVPRSTIRFWETEFPELIQPKRTNGGQRRYSDEDIHNLKEIKGMLYQKNRSITEARNILRNGNADIGKINWKKQSILVTGGTGSFGRHFCRIMAERYKPKTIRVYSRNESSQSEMRQEFSDVHIRFFIGDVRDADRLRRAMESVDIVIHAAALSQADSCDYNPLEAIKTNIFGASNVIDAAIDVGVKKVMAISSEKSVYPVNLYGATALCAEKIFIQGNVYSGLRPTRFSCFRCGQTIDSKGSLISLLKEQKNKRIINIINKEMTRFWITMEQAVKRIIKSLEIMEGGEVFVPQVPSIRIKDFIKAIAPECEVRSKDIMNGEKIHEVIISEEDSHNTIQHNEIYIIFPNHWRRDREMTLKGERMPVRFVCTSKTNNEWLSIEDIKRLI